MCIIKYCICSYSTRFLYQYISLLIFMFFTLMSLYANDAIIIKTAQNEVINTTVQFVGQLKPQSSVLHYAASTGVVYDIYVHIGDTVAYGQPLFSIMPQTIKGRFNPNIVYANISGIVAAIAINKGMTINNGTQAVELIDEQQYIFSAHISDIDYPFITTKTIFTIIINDTQYSGKLKNRAIRPNKKGLFPIDISFSPKPGLYIGQFVTVNAIIKQNPGIYIPITSIVRRFNNSYIWLIDNEKKAQLHQIQLGNRFNNQFHVIKGMEIGMRYIENTMNTIIQEGQIVE